MRSTKPLLFCLSLCSVLLFTASAFAQDNTPPDTENPYISDGTFKKSPFKFKYTVTGIEPDIDEFNRPLLKHFSTAQAATIISDFQKAYKTQQEVSPGYTVAGYFTKSKTGVQSFTFREKGTNNAITLDIIDDPNTNGSIIILNARPMPMQKAVWRLSWYGYSPAQGKAYSLQTRPF